MVFSLTDNFVCIEYVNVNKSNRTVNMLIHGNVKSKKKYESNEK